MRQLSLAIVSAWILLTTFSVPVAANSHPVVTTPPRTGVGDAAAQSPLGLVVLLVAASALFFLLSIRQWRRA